MPSINVQGVGTVNFPDNMSHADIIKAIEKDILPKQGKPEVPSEDSSDLVRGFTSYGPQLKQTFGGAKVLVGKAFGSEALMKSGIESMEEAKQALRAKSKPTDSFSEALNKGMGAVLTDWLPYQMGSGAANLLESVAVMGAGAAVGSVVPGYGTAVGGVLGFIEKELTKKGVKEAAEKILKESGEEVAKKFVEQKTAEAAKKVARDVAATSALAAQAGFHGAGETTSRAVEEAQRLGKEATDIEMGRVVPAAIVHGVAEFVGDKIGLGAFNKIDLNQKNLLLNFAKNLVTTGTKEAPVEVIQSTAERYGARLSLSDAEAIKEYVDSAAAAYAMSVVPAAGGAVKTRGMAGIDERSKQLQEQFRQEAEQEMAAGTADIQKAEVEAQKIGTTAVPDAQGNVQPIRFEPVPDATAVTPVDKGLQTAAAIAVNEGQKAEVTAAKGKEAINELVGNAYAEHSSGKKVLAALKPQLEAMGITDVKEQKAVIDEARTSLNIPTGNTKEGREAKKVWQQQWPEQKEAIKNAQQLSQSVAGGSELGAPSAVPRVGEPTTELTAPDVSRMEPARGTPSTVVSPAGEQRAALTPEENRAAEEARLAKEAELAEEARLAEVARLTELARLEEQEAALPPKRTIKLEEDKTAPVEKHTPEQAAFLKMKTKTRAKPAESIAEGMGYAAAETAFDFYDSAYSAINKALKPQIQEENVARQRAYEDAINRGEKVEKPEPATALDIIQKMPEAELMNLFYENVNSNKLTQERRTAIDVRDNFIKSLSKEQQETIRKQAVELFQREIRGAKNLGRTTTEADLRKSREQAAKEAVEKQLEEIEKPARRKVTPTKQKTGPTQIETLEQKRDATIQKALESGEVDRVFAAIANEKINDSVTAFFARKLYDVLKAFDARPNIVIGQVEEGRAGKYDPSTETITIDLNNLGKERLDIVALHELTHYMADHVIDNRGSLTKEQQNALNRLDNLYKYVNSKLGKKFEIGNLKEFVAQAFSNPEFQKAMGNLPSMETEGKKQNVFSIFAKRIMEMLGFRNRLLSPEELKEVGGTYGAVLGDVLTQIEQIIKVDRTAPAVGVSYMAKKAGPVQNRSVEEMKSEQKTGKPTAAPKRLYNAMLTGKLGHWAETKFVNDRAPLKRWQEKLEYAGRVVAYGVGMNNIYDQIVLSSGNAHWMYTQYVQALNEDMRQGVAEYAKKKDLSVEEALQELSLYAIYRHMQERRETLYMKKVKLSDAPVIKFTDAKGNVTNISPATMREEIFKQLNTNDKLSDVEITYLDKTLRDIVFDKNNTYLHPDVIGKDASNIDSTSFDVAGTYTAQEIAEIKKDYEKNKADVDPIFKTVKALNKTVLKLNKMSNRMSKFAENWIKFYGWENYVPLKGKNVSEEAELLNLDSRRLGGELQDAVYTFQGNHQIPDNPILQVMADGALAAMHVSLNNVTESIYNASKYSKDKNPNGSGVLPTAEVDKIINFEERQDNKFVKSLGGETKVFHYMPDGKVAVITIKDKALLESIRRSYREINPTVDFLNRATGFFGQLHTRFNIAFAPVNFVRDVLTNAFTMGAELGPKAAFDYIASVAKSVVTGGLFKTLKFNRLYAQGKIAEIEQLAKDDKSGYYQAIVDYIKTGGKVSYLAGIANKGQFDELYKEAGPGRVLVGKKITKFFDGWIDMFEVAARVAAFKVAKDTAMGEASREGKTGPNVEKEAIVRGAAYAKNLANFEQVGQWGKALGAFYMFFRPSATGAVRALDALMPAFLDAQQAKMRQPDFAVAAALREELEDKTITGTRKLKLEAQLKDAEKALDKFDSTFAQRKQNAKIVSMALMGVGLVVYQMAKSAADDDDLGRNKVATDDMSRWTKFARFYIPGFEQPFQLPWGFGLGAFAALGAQMGAMLGGNTRVGDSLANMLTITLDSFLPLPISRISPAEKPLEFAIDSTLPSIVRPLVEYVMNVDALGRQIYNNRQSRFGDAYTGGDSVPEAYKMAAQYLANTTNGDLDISPNTLYFFANSYADGASRLMHNGMNIGLWLSGDKDFNPKTDTLILDSFVGTKSNFDAREWQRIENDLKEREKRINMFKERPMQYAEYLAAHPLDQMLVDMYNHDTQGHLKNLREQANNYRAMEGLSPKDRKQIVDTIVQQENFEKFRLIELYKAMGVNP